MSLSYISGNNIIQPLFSAQEMLDISNQISRNFSPVAPTSLTSNNSEVELSKHFLQEVSQNISSYYAPKLSPTTKSLTLLAINPQHLSVHWNLGANNSHLLLPAMLNDELILRIYAQAEIKKDHVKLNPIMELPVHSIQQQKEITIPPSKDQTLYSAYIGQRTSENTFNSLIQSNKLHISSGKSLPSPSNEYIDTTNHAILFEQMKIPHPTQKHYAGTNHSGLGIKRDKK